MARTSKRRPPVRRASPDSSREQGAQSGGGTASLRLAVTKGGLGLELAEPLAVGWLEIEQLSISLVGLSFPLDLSGGVAKFRHRRGELERLSFSVRRDKLISALAPRLRGALGGGVPSLTLTDVAGGVMIGLVEGARAIAFDLLWAPSEGDARLVIGGARGIGLPAAALGTALCALDSMMGAGAARTGALVSFSDAAGRIAREALPAIGVRVPATDGVRVGPLETDGGSLRTAFDAAFAPPLLSSHVIRELELARLAEHADSALAEGRLDDARNGYVSLLERSPRDADLARRLADLDRVAGGRSEAALATLLDVMPFAEAGALAAELLAETGNAQGAVRALRQAADREPYGPLAALMLLRASGLAGAVHERLELLGLAIARAPALEATRWARLELRLDRADLPGAMADAEHLEAGARGAHRRHEVWRRAAESFLAHGHHAKAITLFERALRYVPDHPAALSGLARSLLLAGRKGRALDLMARAVELAERKGAPSFGAVLTLARALAESAGDRSRAIARLRTIPGGEPESLEARGLEGRYRAALGDGAGASLAFARLRDSVESSKPVVEETSVTAWLLEAARFELDTKNDVPAAQRHLAVALDLSPRNGKVLSMFRQVAKQLASARPAAPPVDQLLPKDEERDAERADSLADRLRAEPANDSVVIELADVLGRLGRDLDVFALLSARLEDATGPARAPLINRQVAVLGRLVEQARLSGRTEEEKIYRDALVTIDR